MAKSPAPLPEIEIIDWTDHDAHQGPSRPWAHLRSPSPEIVNSHEFAMPLVDSIEGIRSRLRHRRLFHQVTPSPRLHDTVTHRVALSPPLLMSRLEAIAQDGGAALRWQGPFEPDEVPDRWRCAGHLRVPWCWPSLPVWLRVTQWWNDQSTLILELRSKRRLHYPLRYFPVAHTQLHQAARQAGANPPQRQAHWGHSQRPTSL